MTIIGRNQTGEQIARIQTPGTPTTRYGLHRALQLFMVRDMHTVELYTDGGTLRTVRDLTALDDLIRTIGR